jgi:hypothetical protein
VIRGAEGLIRTAAIAAGAEAHQTPHAITVIRGCDPLIPLTTIVIRAAGLVIPPAAIVIRAEKAAIWQTNQRAVSSIR